MKKHFSLLLMVLLLIIQGAQAAVDYLYFSDDSGLRYKAIIKEYQGWEESGSDLHQVTKLYISYAIVCEPAVGNYVGIKTIPETVEFYGDDYVWKDHGIVHFDPKTLKVIRCESGIFEHCLALKKVSFPISYEQVYDKGGNPTKFNSLGVSFKDCTSLLEVENMNLSSIYANQFEGCSSLKKMDLSKTADIWESAFSGCSSLEELTFKSNVQIRDNAFSNCNAIKKITVQSESNPNSFNDNVFTQTVYEQATLIVPKGKVNKYKRTNGWKNFFKIYEEGSEPSTDPTIVPTDSVTLMVNSYSRQYGEDNPTFEYTVVSGKVESGTPTITCAATKTSPVGTYDIIIEKSSVSNKFVTLVNGTLTITKAPLTISVGNYSKVEGEANPSFTLSYSGFKNGENSSILTKQPTISCSATASSAPGTYPITVSGAEAQNYSISYKNGTLTITAKQTPPVEDAKPYVVYNNGTLTFYCDNQRSSRGGTTYDLNEYPQWPQWIDDHNKDITKAVFDTSFRNAKPTTTFCWFDALENLTEVMGMENLNTSEVTHMGLMFMGCNKLSNIDLSHFDTKNVTNMGLMFYESGVQELDLSSFDTNNTTIMQLMFGFCQNLSHLTLGNTFVTNEETNVDYIFSECQSMRKVSFTGDIPSSINSKFFEGVGTADSPATLDVPEAYKANYQMKFDGNKFYGGYFRLNGNDDNPVDAPLEMTCKVLNAVDGIVYDSEVIIKKTWKNTSEQEFNQYAGYKVHRQLENGEWFKNWRGSSSKYALQPGQSLGMRETLLDFEDGFYKVEWGYDDENDNWVSMGSTIIEVRGHDQYKAIWFDEVTMKTFCDDDNLDFSNVEGLKVYIATEFNASTSEVKMQQVNDAVAGTGLLLVGETGCYLAERTASASTYSPNMLVGVLGETTYIKSNEDGYTNFIYNGNNKNDEQKFIIASDKGSPVISNEAYLRVPSQAAGDTQTITPVFDKPTVSDEPYVVYNDITLTFYYDNQRSSRQGIVYSLNEGENDPKWVLDDNNRNVKMVVFDASFAKARPTTTYSWFLNCDYLTEIKGIENLNTSEVKNMHTMFAFCKRLKSLDVSHFDTKAVQDMGAMFSCCTSLEDIDLRSFDTSNVFMLLSMFNDCPSLTELDLSNFNTSRVEYMDYMFNGCSNLTTLYLGSKFTSTDNVGCDEAFAGCQSLSKVVFTGDIPASINSKFFEGVGTADSPAILDVPEQFEANYAAKFNGNKFYGGYFTLREEIEPDDNGGQDYGNGNGEIDETTNLNGNIIGNVYYQISPDKGGYNSAEGCLVVTEPSSDADLDYDNPFGDEFKNMYTGIVIMVQSGSGTIKVEAETYGGMTLKVKVGNNSPITMSFQNKSTLSIPYTVTRPSYVYIYAGGLNATRAVAEGALKIYSFSWESSASGIDDISNESQTFDVYSLSGAMVKKGATSLNALPKGVYIVNGRKVVIK